MKLTRFSIAYLVAALYAANASALTTYRLVDVGALSGACSGVLYGGRQLNERGEVTGFSCTAPNGIDHGFFWDGAAIADIGTLGGLQSRGIAVNESGQVTGAAEVASGEYRAYVWDAAGIKSLGSLGGNSFGVGINNAGWIAVQSYLTGYSEPAHAALWNSAGVLADLGTLGGHSSYAAAINSSGMVSGSSWVPGNAVRHAFLWDGTRMVDLDPLGVRDSGALDINDAGEVAGYADSPGYPGYQQPFYSDGKSILRLGDFGGHHGNARAINEFAWITGFATTPSGQMHAFVWNRTTLIDIGAFNGMSSDGFDINAAGQVVGHADTTTEPVAFIWDGAGILDLNTLIDPVDPLKGVVWLSSAMNINDKGQIVANGCDTRTGECHAYRLDPVNPDTTAPEITHSIAGAIGTQGWYVGNVSINWGVSDPEAGTLASRGCEATYLASDTPGLEVKCSAASTGGRSSETVTVRRDATPPTITVGKGNKFTCSDALSGIQSCTGAVKKGRLTVVAQDRAGNISTR